MKSVFVFLRQIERKFASICSKNQKKHEKFHLQPAANRTKICSKKFSKKKLFSRFCCKLKSFFLVFAANGSNLIEFSHVAYVKKRAPETSFFLPKHHLRSHFCLFINSIVNNISKCKLYWTLFARRGPLPRVSSRFMTSSLSFILKRTCSQKEEKQIGDFLVLLLKRLLRHLEMTNFRAISGFLLQITTNFLRSICSKNAFLRLQISLFFFAEALYFYYFFLCVSVCDAFDGLLGSKKFKKCVVCVLCARLPFGFEKGVLKTRCFLLLV